MSARRALLERLIDHAALFPPASLPMDAAIEADRRARACGEAWILDRFICPATRLHELPEDPPPLSVVFDGEPSADPSSLPIELVEARGATLQRIRDVFGQEPKVFVELAVGDGLEPALAGLSNAGAGAKLRCGGLTADAFPSVREVARFACACEEIGLPWKATAGLHHPVRHVDPGTGFHMHGFLNLLAAAAFADEGEEAVAAIVAEEDPVAFTADDREFGLHGFRADADAVARMRSERLVAYGSCSFSEPVEDLTALGILPA